VLFRRDPFGCLFSEAAGHVELNDLRHKSPRCFRRKACPGLQPDRRIAWKQVRLHVLCVRLCRSEKQWKEFQIVVTSSSISLAPHFLIVRTGFERFHSSEFLQINSDGLRLAP
jgi:hypothetical protein